MQQKISKVNQEKRLQKQKIFIVCNYRTMNNFMSMYLQKSWKVFFKTNYVDLRNKYMIYMISHLISQYYRIAILNAIKIYKIQKKKKVSLFSHLLRVLDTFPPAGLPTSVATLLLFC